METSNQQPQSRTVADPPRALPVRRLTFAPSVTALGIVLGLIAGIQSVAHAAPPVTPTIAPAEVPGQHRGDPDMNVPGAMRGTHYGSETGGRPVTPQLLFGKSLEPSGREMKQGRTGDCYMDATAATYAEFHKPVIKSVFLTKSGALRTSENGSPAARFFHQEPHTHDFEPSTPAIYSGRAPLDNKKGTPVLDKVVDQKIWGSQLEMAFAKFRDGQGGLTKSDNPNKDRTGINRIGSGGYANHVMQALTGKKAELVDFHSSKADEVWNRLKTAQDQNLAVVVGSAAPSQLRARAKEQIEAGMLDPAAIKHGQLDPKMPDLKFDGQKWIKTHAYSAWGDRDHPFLFEKNGERFIRLRNPWGSHPPDAKGEDGIGVVPFNQFLLHYTEAYIGAGTPKAE
jgi:hypothetical protein